MIEETVHYWYALCLWRFWRNKSAVKY